MISRFCGICGREMEVSSKFCGGCGSIRMDHLVIQQTSFHNQNNHGMAMGQINGFVSFQSPINQSGISNYNINPSLNNQYKSSKGKMLIKYVLLFLFVGAIIGSVTTFGGKGFLIKYLNKDSVNQEIQITQDEEFNQVYGEDDITISDTLDEVPLVQVEQELITNAEEPIVEVPVQEEPVIEENTPLEAVGYHGEMKDGLENGFGIWVSDTGARYEGQWKDGMFNGYGIYTWGSGNRYEGDFKNHMFFGEGTLKSEDGSVYVGSFRNHMKNGSGTLTKPDGTVISGTWENDSFVK